MASIEKLILEDDDGQSYTILVQNKTVIDASALRKPSDDDTSGDYEESYGFTEDAIVKLKDVHGAIRAYTRYAIGAFKNLGGAQVEEITLRFGVKVAGRAGIPVLTEGSAESNFEIEVKCKPL